MKARPLSWEYIRPTYAMVILQHDMCNKGTHKVKLVKASRLSEKESHDTQHLIEDMTRAAYNTL
jgi:hypothetical protein